MIRFIWWMLIILPLFIFTLLLTAFFPHTSGILPFGVIFFGWVFAPRRRR